MRPWLNIEVRPGAVLACFPIASQAYGQSAFLLDLAHTDFPATGLKKTCYILDTHIYEVPQSGFRNQRGALRGELLEAFRQYAAV